jgi:hypothetical protein
MLSYSGTPVSQRRKYIRLTVVLLAAWLLTQWLAGFSLPAIKGSGTVTGADLGRLPLSFEPNAGQTNQSVLFTARAGESTFFFARSEVVISIAAQRSAALPLSGGKSNPREVEAPEGKPKAVRLSFMGAGPNPRVSAGPLLPGTVNYFLGSDPARWHTNLPTYSGITYSGLYPGIELHYEGTQRSLKGTYTLAAEADPAAIRWHYVGAEAVSVDALGNLQVRVGDAALTEQAPAAWQEINGQRIPVRVAYDLAADNTVGFALGKYDSEHELIIDPTLSYSTFLGGNSADYGFAIDVDGQGSVYVTGAAGSTDFPVVNSIYPPSPNGDVFVTKINPDATAIVYSSLIGGNSSDVGFGIEVDAAGSAYVTGETWSTDFPLVNPFDPYRGAYQSDAFLLKVNPSGSALFYSTYLGGDGADTARDIAVDGDGSAYLTGHTLSINFPLANPFQGTINGYQDGFVTKFNPSGSALVFSTYLGGFSGIEYSNSIAIDSQRAVYVAGYTASTDFPLHNPIQPTNHGNDDTFITKFNPPGTSLAYSTYLGGSLNDNQYSGLAVDPAGNAYVTGYTGSTDFPVVNAYQSIKGGFDDVFLTKVNATGTAWVYSTYLGGIFSDGHYHTIVAADAQGNAYVGGNTASSDFPLLNNIQTGNIDSADDGFVTKFSPSGQELVYSTRIGGNNGGHFYNLDHIYGLALDEVGNVYITGETNSPQYPTTSGVFQPTKSGNYDSFISKISAQGPNTPTPTVTGTPPTATPTPCNAGANYTVTQQSGASIVPGTQDIGNHCELCITPYTLPFPLRLYDRTFTRALVGNNGAVGFVANQNFSVNQCLPPTDPPMFNYAILPFWGEVRTDGYGITCPSGCGIFTSLTGSAPNRTLHMEWRGSRFYNGTFHYVNFELRLFESSPNFEVIYGVVRENEGDVTVGVQRDTGSRFTQYACDMPGSITQGLKLTFALPSCGSPPPTSTPQATPTRTATVVQTQTPLPTSSRTPTPAASAQSTSTVISTATNTAVPPGATPTPTRTPCPMPFTDVVPTDYFYEPVRRLRCRGVVSGYADNTFRPYANATRGQLTKIVVLGFDMDLYAPPAPTFSDVAPDHPFYSYVETVAREGLVSGYSDGTFRPSNNVTRSQLSKIVVEAAGWPLYAPPAPTFIDVPPSHPFNLYIETAYLHQIVQGYSDGTFRPFGDATRGQIAKVVDLAAGSP